MMPLRYAGFFRELRHGRVDGPSLAESRQSSADPDEQRILGYLADGTTLAATGKAVDDVLDDGKKAVATLKIVTDGAWLWPGDLPYYIAQYHVSLPPDFTDQMRANSWKPPKLDRPALLSVEKEYRQG
jgi:hypothetical protein